MDDDLKSASLDNALLREGLITRVQLQQAREERYQSEKTLPAILIENNAITEKALLEFFQARMGFEVISLKDAVIDPKACELIPRTFAEHKRLIPVRFEYDTLILAMEDPSDYHLLDDLRHRLGIPIKAVAASAPDLTAALAEFPESTGEELTEENYVEPLWRRILSPVFLPVMLCAPIILLLIMMIQGQFPEIRRMSWQWVSNKYDFMIQFFAVYGAWSVILWFFNGLLFPPPPRKKIE